MGYREVIIKESVANSIFEFACSFCSSIYFSKVDNENCYSFDYRYSLHYLYNSIFNTFRSKQILYWAPTNLSYSDVFPNSFHLDYPPWEFIQTYSGVIPLYRQKRSGYLNRMWLRYMDWQFNRNLKIGIPKSRKI